MKLTKNEKETINIKAMNDYLFSQLPMEQLMNSKNPDDIYKMKKEILKKLKNNTHDDVFWEDSINTNIQRLTGIKILTKIKNKKTQLTKEEMKLKKEAFEHEKYMEKLKNQPCGCEEEYV